MDGKTGARWGGRLVLALLLLGWAVAATPARADEPAKKLTEENRDKLEKEAVELNEKAARMYQDRQYAAATELLEKELIILQRLYTTDKYPDGQSDLATCLNNLGTVLSEQGEYGKAEPLLRDALQMRKRLYFYCVC